jgi:hypothetical protein
MNITLILTFLICITVIILISRRIHTYFTLCLFATIMLVMYCYNEHGNLNSSVWLSGRWCQIRTYFAFVCLCALYYSFILQATLRLFRIVFHRRKIIQSFDVFVLAIIFQWGLSFIFILPNLLIDDFQYLSSECNC